MYKLPVFENGGLNDVIEGFCFPKQKKISPYKLIKGI